MKSPNLKYKSTFFNFLISLFNFFHSLYFFLYFKFVDLNFVFVSKQISNSYIKWIHFNRYWALFLIFVFNVEKIRFFIISIQNLNTHLNYSLNTNIKLFVFTSNEGKDILQSSRLNEKKQIILPNSNVIFNTKYQNVFDIPKLSKYKNQYEKVAKIMQKAGI